MYKNLLRMMLLLVLAVGGFSYSKYHDRKDHKTYEKLSTDNLLAISWQNAFCQTHQQKRECRNVKPTAFSASHFTLHGLWPQPRNRVNCKGAHKVFLEKKLYHTLLEVMPAAKSGLHKHEWKKHGTCYGKSQDAYFTDAIALLKQINASAVRELFTKNVGKVLSKKQLMLAFDKSFGKGAGRKVKMMCKKGS